ncbi:MAG: hypothetical protein WA777_21555 [Rhodanobacter sp.]
MNIQTVKFIPRSFVDLAIDADNGVKLIGIPFDDGGSGHTRYYAISNGEFEKFLVDESGISELVIHGNQYIGASPLYFSDFAPDNVS